jgi:lipopolysaccharide/colanic/teichoic acid biosynthesis glycosyltransferase
MKVFNATSIKTVDNFDRTYVNTEISSEMSRLVPFRTPLENKWNLLYKRTIDLVFSTLLIIFLLSWLLPLLIILIKLDSRGAAFFLQKRNKRGGALFTCIKLRTMVLNNEADQLPADIDDRRITKVGKFLRRHHLDELPQLLNVWWGDMSLIGPRPYMISDNIKFEKFVNHYHTRDKVKPGITGLSQVLGLVGPVINNENVIERVIKDIYYINNWTLFLDLKIAYRTFFKMIGKN